MKVILDQKIDRLGNKGDIVEVKPGYARNYLFPKSIAKELNKINLIALKEKRVRDNNSRSPKSYNNT